MWLRYKYNTHLVTLIGRPEDRETQTGDVQIQRRVDRKKIVPK